MSNKHVSEQLEQLKRRVNREKEARHHAEKLLTEKSEALYLKLTETQQLRKNLELALGRHKSLFGAGVLIRISWIFALILCILKVFPPGLAH